ncbi:TPA: hypothetical protein ACT2TS_001869 [Citrobacter braakii]|uniref:hypothetical protein n=1 Tax=Citrobacter sp. KTE151 TaxID=1169322 RepID=UPI00032E9DEF|nr:hypothetical protein [Citrobacter sp. KTE151]EOQ48441.1 hypothetical protein WC7_02685 [Citrobacter sp. KTE151]NCL79168.1 hypothetical protein [Citrobacter braakii]
MNDTKINDINDKLITSIYTARSDRVLFEKDIVNKLPDDYKFLFKYKNFDINQLISLSEGNYKQVLTILITKQTAESVKGGWFINRFIDRPYFYILILSVHPESKVKVNGIAKYTAVKILRKNRYLFDIARKIYNRMRG